MLVLITKPNRDLTNPNLEQRRGCAFEGAQISLFPYADAVHLVHGPDTCLGASWETRATLTSYEGENNTPLGYCTNVTTQDIIFGGDKKLGEALAYIVEHKKPKAIFVYETCVTAMIGDNIDYTCKCAEEQFGIPIVPVHSPGFVGSKNLGSRLAGEAVLDALGEGVSQRHSSFWHQFDRDYMSQAICGSTIYLEPLVSKSLQPLWYGRLKYTNSTYGKAYVIVCAKSLVTLCRKMQERYNIPYVSVSFYGKRDTSNAIRSIVNAFGDEALIERAEAVIAEEEAKLEERLRPYHVMLKGKKAILNTGGNKSWSIASALQDIGIEVVATSIQKATEEDIAIAKEYVPIVFKSPATEQPRLIDEHNIDILLAGGRSLYTAIKKRIAFVDVNQEKKVSYGAYVA